MQQTRLIIVKGKVQGVYFRQTTLETASALNIVGTVRNLKDGSVEIVATGTGESVQKLITWCHTGPSRAKVEEVIVQELQVQEFLSFSINR